MNICFLNMPIEYYSPISGGAISTIIMQSARYLIRKGHDVTVLTITNEDETYPVGRIVPITVKRREDLPIVKRKLAALQDRLNHWDWPYYRYYQQSFTRALESLRPAPDAVIVFNDFVSPKYIKASVPGAKVFVWLQNEQGTRQADLRATMAATTAILTCSRCIADWTAKRYTLPESKFVVLNSGVDLETFTPRADFLNPVSPVRALFIGRIDPNKGPDIAADVVVRLKEESLPVCLTVVGGLWFYRQGDEMADPYFRSLKTKMDAAEARYLGHVTRHNVAALIREHDIAFVLSRSNEPFGLVVLEAMASGCAVISSNRGGLPEACDGAAILVDPDDFEAVLAATRTLIEKPDVLRERKQQAVARASRAGWDNMGDALEQILVSR